MTSYRVATGHDVVLGSLTVLDPQPSPGPIIEVTKRTFAADGSVTDQGLYIELPWPVYESDTTYQSLLTLFGLSASVSSADVTVYVRDSTFAWVRMNGVAIRPEPGQDITWGDRMSRPLSLKILVKNLETAA